MKYGLVWGKVNALTKPQLLALKRAAGLRLRDAPQDAMLAFYSVLNDEYRYNAETENKLFFTLCVDAMMNRYDTPEDKIPDPGTGTNLEDYLRYLYNKDEATDSTKRDITALCAEKHSRCGRLEKHMMQYIHRMKRDKGRPHLNTAKLEKDLLDWDKPSHAVQMKWGRAIVRPAGDNNGSEKEGESHD